MRCIGVEGWRRVKRPQRKAFIHQPLHWVASLNDYLCFNRLKCLNFIGDYPMATSSHLIESIFETGRSHGHWLPEPVSEDLLRALYERAKWGPTSMNSQPMRLQFVVSPSAKEKLAACLNPANRPKALSAPVTVIVGHDLSFPETLSTLFPHKTDALSY